MELLERDLLPTPVVGQATASRTLTLDDFWRLKPVTEVQATADGSAVAYVVTAYNEARNEGHSAIWLYSDGRARQFTSGEAVDMQPRWSPDGQRLAFVSSRQGGKPQIFIIDRNGGEPRRITKEENGAVAPAWSPDGRRICYAVATSSDRQRVSAEKAWFDAHPEAEGKGAQLRRQASLMSRFDARGYIDKRIHLFLIDADATDGKARQLTEGDCDDAGASWSPDGSSIAFVANRSDDQEHTFGTDIWTLDVESGTLSCLTDGTLMAGEPSWSPDGRRLAFYASPSWSSEGYRDAHLWLVSREGGDQHDLSGSVDLGHRHVQGDYTFPDSSAPAWSSDSRTVFFTLIDHGDDAVYAADVDGGNARRLSSPGTDVLQLSRAGDSLALLAVRPDHPFDAFTMPMSGGAPEPLASTNADVLEGVTLVAPRRLTWIGPKSWEIEGWLYAPDAATPAPLIVHVHGGPYGAWGESFYFQAQVLAGMGYASLYVNPRGSLGYGQEFSAAADWGEDDFRDIMAGVDAAIATGAVDGSRLGITGISYGGFMTNWAVGHTDRLSAGVSVNGVSNQQSMYGVSDMSALWLPHEFGGHPWESDETLARFRHHSPLSYVDRISAPLLLIQSEDDYRCPIEQGEQMLTALRARRQRVELIRFPGCSHVISSSGTPLQRWLQWKVAFDWFDAHVKQEESAAPVADEGGVTLTEQPVEC